MVNSVLPQLFKKAISIDLNSRHGAVIAIGEIFYSLSKVALAKNNKLEDLINDSVIEFVRNLIPTYKERLYFRGMGGELMRQACSYFIEKSSLAHVPFNNMDVVSK